MASEESEHVFPSSGAPATEKILSHEPPGEGVAKNYGKKSYHRNYRLRKVKIAASLAIGALASLDVISGAGTSALTNTLRVISVNAAYSISDIGNAVDDSFQFGWAHSDYSATEIEECLEATLSMDVGNKVAQEQANRLVREIGMVNSVSAATGAGGPFNDGRQVKTRLNWLLSIGDTLNLWVRNASGTVYTTGAFLIANGEIWVKD